MKTHHGIRVAIVVGALLLSPVAFASPAAAEVVYTQANVTLSGNGSINLDLNHDGIVEFVLRSHSRITSCGLRDGLIGFTKMIPATGDGVAVSHLNFAALLGNGVPIDANQTFYLGRTVVTQFSICSSGSQHLTGYLGLEFQLDGQTHYGWAQVDIYAYFSFRGHKMRTTLIDFAYETIPGQPIKTGQTH